MNFYERKACMCAMQKLQALPPKSLTSLEAITALYVNNNYKSAGSMAIAGRSAASVSLIGEGFSYSAASKDGRLLPDWRCKRDLRN